VEIIARRGRYPRFQALCWLASARDAQEKPFGAQNTSHFRVVPTTCNSPATVLSKRAAGDEFCVKVFNSSVENHVEKAST
jgi:hypothetical protein